MTNEPDLFGFKPPAKYPDAPGHRGQETSVEAADAIAPKIGRLQNATLDEIERAGAHVRTTDDAAEDVGQDRWSIQLRVSELKQKGLVVDSGIRRWDCSGKRAVVWCLPDYRRSDAA